MKIDVHILATCLNPAMLDTTLLVFKTLRTGFPDANVKVWENALTPEQSMRLRLMAGSFIESIMLPQRIAHDAWIAGLLDRSTTPFWILDTDVIFFEKAPEPSPQDFLFGRFEPAFLEPWTKTNRVSRLHTALLYFDPIAIRIKILEWAKLWQPKDFPFSPSFELIQQHFVPQGVDRPPMFYDTCAGLYQAIGGTSFTESQNHTFEHLHCGTYSDRIQKALPDASRAREVVSKNIANARGLFDAQEDYYRNHPANMVEN